MTDNNILSAVQETTSLILRFKAAIEETKKKFSHNPKYLALSVAQSQKQIQKMIHGIYSLLGVHAGDALPFSFGMYGDDNPEGLVRIDSLKSYLDFLGKSVKEASSEIDPSLSSGDFLIRAASTNSLHISIEPSARAGEKGFQIIQKLGEAIKEIYSLKFNKDKPEISTLAKRVWRLIPRKKLHLSKVEFSGSSFFTDPMLFEAGQVKSFKSRIKKEDGSLLPIFGNIVAIDGERKTAFLAGDPRTKFHYSENQETELLELFMKTHVKVNLRECNGKKMLVTIEKSAEN